MKTVIFNFTRRTLAVIACIAVMLSEVAFVNAAEKVTESMQSNCSCVKVLLRGTLRGCECIDASQHCTWYYNEYACQHGTTGVEEAEIEAHSISTSRDLGHVSGTIMHKYCEACSLCSYEGIIYEICYCDR